MSAFNPCNFAMQMFTIISLPIIQWLFCQNAFSQNAVVIIAVLLVAVVLLLDSIYECLAICFKERLYTCAGIFAIRSATEFAKEVVQTEISSFL